MAKIEDQLEDGVFSTKKSDGRGGEDWITFNESVQLSQAISLKRIADELCGTADIAAPGRLGLVDSVFEAIARARS